VIIGIFIPLSTTLLKNFPGNYLITKNARFYWFFTQKIFLPLAFFLLIPHSFREFFMNCQAQNVVDEIALPHHIVYTISI
jgi:hypothetical protein